MIGERIHSYEITAHLGQGGMGNVFKATDNMLGREVALKMLHPQLTVQSQFLERFKKEARVLAQLLHPNIAVIYNFIEQGGNHFMVMEYVEGTSLDDLLKKYRVLPASFVVPVCIQALEGLQHAHRKNIFHRDIKPANLMITEEATLKLMDFGIAKVAGEQKMTQVNKIVGTIEFMAPELIEGKEASGSSDIYSMGATIYELISGKVPFEGDTDFSMMEAILKSRPKVPEKLNPSIPKALSDIVMKAMDKNPENRYPNARAFQQALIAAFPQYRDIDMEVLRKVQYDVKPTVEQSAYQATGSETRVSSAKPITPLRAFQEKISGKRRISLAILALLIFVVAIFSITTLRGKGDQPLPGNDTTTATPANDGGAGISNMPAPVQEKLIIPDAVNRIPVGDETNKEEKQKPVTEKPRRTYKAEENNSPEKVEETVTPSEPKQTEKKDIQVGSGVTVSLSLTSTPDMNQKQKAAQRVSFTVTKPVYYNGTLIIRQGATATGTITIGRVMTDIEIHSVEAANGKSISLKAEKAHGRRSDLESGKSYNAVVQPGTRISFR